MTATISFFPVGNGDMTLIETDSGKKILIDCNIRSGDDHPDVTTQLKERLSRDDQDRLYVDLFIWTHPDEDHCRGVSKNFYLGKPEDWNEDEDEDEDLIFIRGIWSSPIVFRRADKAKHKLSEDAKSLNKEAKRRVQYFKDHRHQNDGNYIQILCKDEGDKTDTIEEIVLQLDEATSMINGDRDDSFSAQLLGPAPKADLDEDDEKLGKNHSSVILNFTLRADNNRASANFLNGGDAEVVCWETLWDRMNQNNTCEYLEYDVLQAPHHCSWHTMSHESWSEAKEDGRTAEASSEALDALGQARDSAFIIASSKTIEEGEADPPSHAAKAEYEKILKPVSGSFKCVADHKKKGENVPLVIEISGDNNTFIRSLTSIFSGMGQPSSAVNRDGGSGYA